MKKLIGVLACIMFAGLAIDSGQIPVPPRFNPIPTIGDRIAAVEMVGHELWVDRMNANAQR